jgi:NDP-sugar pyrophosphorylase family protein
MKAIILAAGLGTRLGDITNYKPKALVCFNGKPMLQGVLENLKTQGFNEILINVHHFAEKIIDFLNANDYFGMNITISDERKKLLDTGGAIKNAASFFNGIQAVLIHNVDVYTNINLKDLVETHNKSDALVTLLVRNRYSTRKLLFDEEMKLKGWKNYKNGEVLWVDVKQQAFVERAFSGIYVASPHYPVKLSGKDSFPVVPQWLKIAKQKIIKGYEHNSSLWFDLGTRQKILEAEKTIKMFM